MERKVRRSARLEVVLSMTRAGSLQQQIGAQWRAAILERRVLPGTLLPSSRQMAAEFDEAPMAEAALAGGVRVGPLSALYQAAPPSHGLMGYAGTPEQPIEPAIQRLGRCLSGDRTLHSL